MPKYNCLYLLYNEVHFHIDCRYSTILVESSILSIIKVHRDRMTLAIVTLLEIGENSFTAARKQLYNIYSHTLYDTSLRIVL